MNYCLLFRANCCGLGPDERSNDLQFRMLVLHGSLHILAPHRLHHRGQIPRFSQDPSAVVMPSAIQDQAFGKPSFCPSFAKPLRQGSKVAGLGALGWKYPSFAPDATPHQEKIYYPISHRDEPSSVGGLTVRDKNHPVVPIYGFNARRVDLNFPRRP